MNEGAISPNHFPANDLAKEPIPPTAFWECASDSDCRCVAEDVVPFFVRQAWPRLPPHIKDAILTLIDAASVQREEASP